MTEKKTALVTGASRGIGNAIAVELKNNGFDVFQFEKYYLSNCANLGDPFIQCAKVTCRTHCTFSGLAKLHRFIFRQHSPLPKVTFSCLKIEK